MHRNHASKLITEEQAKRGPDRAQSTRSSCFRSFFTMCRDILQQTRNTCRAPMHDLKRLASNDSRILAFKMLSFGLGQKYCTPRPHGLTVPFAIQEKDTWAIRNLVWDHHRHACVRSQDSPHRVHPLHKASQEFGSTAVRDIDALSHYKGP